MLSTGSMFILSSKEPYQLYENGTSSVADTVSRYGAIVLKKQLRSEGKGCSSSLGVGWGADNS